MAPIVGEFEQPAPPPPPQVEPETAPTPTLEAVVSLEAQLSQTMLPASTEATVVARVRVRPEPLDSIPRPSVSVALVLDTSGSMAGEPLTKAKEAALEFVDALADSDRISLVAFHSVTETLVPLAPLDDGGRDRVREALEGLEAVGTTDLAGGLAHGFAQVRQGLTQGGAARVLLLSDGRPNDAQTIFPNVQRAAQQGITVTALGLGLSYDEALLGKIAQLSGGGFHFAESPDQLAQMFRDEVLSLQRIVGRHASLSVVPGPGVTVERVLGQHATISGRSVVANIGDLVEGRERDLFVLLRVDKRRPGVPVELLDAHLNFHDALSQTGRTARTYVGTEATASAKTLDDSRNPDVAVTTARALAADDALQVLTLVRSGRLRKAKKRVDRAIRRARKDAARFDDEGLRKQLAELIELNKALPGLAPPKASMHAKRHPTKHKLRSPPRDFEPRPSAARAAKSNHATAMGALGF